MQAERTNKKYMPGHPFPECLQIFSDLAETISTVDDILIAVPSVGFRNTLNALKPIMKPNMQILWATKGMDTDTGKLLHDVVKEVFGREYPYGVLSGPSFAKEVAQGLPTAVIIASEDQSERSQANSMK